VKASVDQRVLVSDAAVEQIIGSAQNVSNR
jgi:hypothetical protein